MTFFCEEMNKRFATGAFILRGKIAKDVTYNIISDYLGTPVETYDGYGNKVWERELDIYGHVKTGRKDVYGRAERQERRVLFRSGFKGM